MRILIIKNGSCETDIDIILKLIDPDIETHIICSKNIDVDYDYFDRIIILGGSQILSDGLDDHPYLQNLIDKLRIMIRNEKRILGICLGAQLIAMALGHTVSPVGRCVMGYDQNIWCADPELQNVSRDFLSLHNDEILLSGDTKVEITNSCDGMIYGFQYSNTLAVQYHPDITPRILNVFCKEFAYDEGLIRHATNRADEIHTASVLFFKKWLE